MKPYFITFEGVDGTGKSTLLKHIEAHLKSYGIDVLVTKEPGGSLSGSTIRDLLFKCPGTTEMEKGQADAMLLYDHIGVSEQIVKPALAKGQWVLCDRYADSQFAYAAAKPTSDAMNEAYRHHYGVVPDITFLLVGTVELFFARAKSRDAAPDALEPGKQSGKVWNRVDDQRKIQLQYVRNLAGLRRTILLPVDSLSAEQVAERAITLLRHRLDTDFFSNFILADDISFLSNSDECVYADRLYSQIEQLA